MTQDPSRSLLSFPQCDFFFHLLCNKMVAPPHGIESEVPGGKEG